MMRRALLVSALLLCCYATTATADHHNDTEEAPLDHAGNGTSHNGTSGHGSGETHMERHEESEGAQAVDLFLVSCVILIAFASARLVQKVNWSGMSESAGIILCGAALGGLIELADRIFSHNGRYKQQIAFDEEFFSHFILPPIIFEAGYTLKHGGIMRNLGTILLYAVIGTMISTLVIGFIIFGVSEALFTELYDLDGAVFACITFGALLSAVDPVAVIAVLSSKFDLGGEPPLLYNLVFGESVLNDAVSIVIFNVMYKFIDREATFGSFMLAFVTFLQVSALSCVIGWCFGALSALFLKHIDFKHHPYVEVIIMMVFAMAGYYLSEALELSGIMAIFLCARIMGHHTWHNLSEYSQENTVYIFKTFAHLAETAVFVLLGMAFWTLTHDFRFGFICLVYIAMLLSRACNVFPLSILANRFRKPENKARGHDGPVTAQMQTFMWFGGLRGAIAFGLALIVKERAIEDDLKIKEKGKHITSEIATVMMSTTLMMVVVTVVIMGGFTEKVLDCLGLTKTQEGEQRTDEFLSDQEQAEAGNTGAQSNACMRRLARWESRHIGPILRCKESTVEPEYAGMNYQQQISERELGQIAAPIRQPSDLGRNLSGPDGTGDMDMAE